MSGTLQRIQEIAEDGNLISNDLADYTLVECSICNLHLPMTRLRSHTKSVHKVSITEYKAMFGPDLTPLAVVWHRCGICSHLIMLDSDHVAVHLKSGGHPRVTHKDYNEAFMVDTRTSKHTSRQPSSRDSFVRQLKWEESRGEEVGEPRWGSRQSPASWQQIIIGLYSSNKLKRRPRVAYEEGEFDIGKVLENPPDGDPQVVIETVTEEREQSKNVIKRLQLNTSNKKLDVIMLN